MEDPDDAPAERSLTDYALVVWRRRQLVAIVVVVILVIPPGVTTWAPRDVRAAEILGESNSLQR